MYNDCINQQNNYKIAVVTVELYINIKPETRQYLYAVKNMTTLL